MHSQECVIEGKEKEKEMAKYKVILYYTTWVEVEVEANDMAEAKEAAYDLAGDSAYDAELLHNCSADEGAEEVIEIE